MTVKVTWVYNFYEKLWYYILDDYILISTQVISCCFINKLNQLNQKNYKAIWLKVNRWISIFLMVSSIIWMNTTSLSHSHLNILKRKETEFHVWNLSQSIKPFCPNYKSITCQFSFNNFLFLPITPQTIKRISHHTFPYYLNIGILSPVLASQVSRYKQLTFTSDNVTHGWITKRINIIIFLPCWILGIHFTLMRLIFYDYDKMLPS